MWTTRIQHTLCLVLFISNFRHKFYFNLNISDYWHLHSYNSHIPVFENIGPLEFIFGILGPFGVGLVVEK